MSILRKRIFVVVLLVALLYLAAGLGWSYYFRNEVDRVRAGSLYERVGITPSHVSEGQGIRTLSWEDPIRGTIYVARVESSSGRVVETFQIGSHPWPSFVLGAAAYVAVAQLLWLVLRIAVRGRLRARGSAGRVPGFFRKDER